MQAVNKKKDHLKSLVKIQANKNLLLTLRRSVYPLRESINKLIRDDQFFKSMVAQVLGIQFEGGF